jgi:hypothetical protein
VLAIAAAVVVSVGPAAQRGQFPGGTNPDGSLRPSAPLTRLFTQDAYTEYEILEPGSGAFRIKFLPLETRAGATEIVNATRGGSEGSGIEVYDPRTGRPLEFTYAQQGNDPEAHAIRATLPRPVPQGGIGRVIIYKTYKDPRTYLMNGDDIVWVRSLSGYRLGVVLPRGYGLLSSNVAAHLFTLPTGQVKLAFANPSGQANPVTIHARKTAARFAATPARDVFFDDMKTLYDLGDPAAGTIAVDLTYSDARKGSRLRLDALDYLALEGLAAVDLDTAAPLPVRAGMVQLEVPIENDRQSAHLNLRGTLRKAGYRLDAGTLVFQRRLHGLRNTVLLPAGWVLASSSQAGTVGALTTPAGPRTFVAFINLNAENQYEVTIRAHRAGQ